MDKYQLTEMGEHVLYSNFKKADSRSSYGTVGMIAWFILRYIDEGRDPEALEEILRTDAETRGQFRRLFEAGYIKKVD